MPKKWMPNCDRCYNTLSSLYTKKPNYKSLGDKYHCSDCGSIFHFVESEEGMKFNKRGYNKSWFFLVKAEFDLDKRMKEKDITLVTKDN